MHQRDAACVKSFLELIEVDLKRQRQHSHGHLAVDIKHHGLRHFLGRHVCRSGHRLRREGGRMLYRHVADVILV